MGTLRLVLVSFIVGFHLCALAGFLLLLAITLMYLLFHSFSNSFITRPLMIDITLCIFLRPSILF